MEGEIWLGREAVNGSVAVSCFKWLVSKCVMSIHLILEPVGLSKLLGVL